MYLKQWYICSLCGKMFPVSFFFTIIQYIMFWILTAAAMCT